MTRQARRRAVSGAFVAACAISVVIALVPLASILWWVATQGLSAMSVDVFTKMPKPVGETGGGMANAIAGSVLLLGMAGLLAVPVGILCGVHLSEFRNGRLAWTARFAADVLNGVPSIVVGMFAYALVVAPVKRFSAFAGSVALAVLMIPLVARTTEEMLNLVPRTLADGARALGATRARAALQVVFPAAMPGIATGILVALARIAGETAPLLFTALGNRYWSLDPFAPVAALSLQIYTYAISAYEDWHRQAWAGALVLVAGVLVLSVLSRAVVRRLARMHRP